MIISSKSFCFYREPINSRRCYLAINSNKLTEIGKALRLIKNDSLRVIPRESRDFFEGTCRDYMLASKYFLLTTIAEVRKEYLDESIVHTRSNT